MSDKEVVEKAINHLKSVFKNKVTNVIRSVVTRWKSNPYCK